MRTKLLILIPTIILILLLANLSYANPTKTPDVRISIRIGTNGVFLRLEDEELQYQTSLQPVGNVVFKMVEMGQDFFQDTIRIYQFIDGAWSQEAIYQTGDSETNFLCQNKQDTILFIHGLFTGDYREWTEAASYLKLHDPSLEIYAVDYGTGFSLADLGRMLDEIIAQGVKQNCQINIIAHSQGGLIARAALELNYASRHKVNTLITLGTPHNGVHYGSTAANAAGKLLNLVPELNDLVRPSHFLNQLNSDIEQLDVNYFFVAGTDRGSFASYWDFANLILKDDLNLIVNDAVVERTSALAEGLNIAEKRPRFERAEFPVDHSKIMSDPDVLAKILKWLNLNN